MSGTVKARYFLIVIVSLFTVLGCAIQPSSPNAQPTTPMSKPPAAQPTPTAIPPVIVDNWQFKPRDNKWSGDFYEVDITITNLGDRRNFGLANLRNPGPELAMRDNTNKITEPWIPPPDPRKGEFITLPGYTREFYPNESWSGSVKFKMNPYAKDLALLITWHYHSKQELLFNFFESNPPTGQQSTSTTINPPTPVIVKPAITTTLKMNNVSYVEIHLSSIANSSSGVSNLPVGDQVLCYTPFKISGNEVFLSQYGASSFSQEAIIGTDIPKVTNLFFLINSTATYPQFMGKQAGKITLIFDTNQIEETNLIVGKNIREYTLDELYGPTVRTVTDPNSQVAWQGKTESRLIAIDMLTISVSPSNQAKALKQIKITDTSQSTTNSSDPGLIVWGITVSKVE